MWFLGNWNFSASVIKVHGWQEALILSWVNIISNIILDSDSRCLKLWGEIWSYHLNAFTWTFGQRNQANVWQTEHYCQELITGQNLETWDGTWDRFPVCRKVRILSDIVVKSTQQSVKFTLSLLCGAKLKLTLTDCGNITNQFASKREVVHHQKEANVLKKFYSSQLTHHSHIIGKLCLEQKQSKKKLPHLEQLPRFSPRPTTSLHCPE